jgi:molecular chaperone GrpE
MGKKIEIDGGNGENARDGADEFRVQDRRHWVDESRLEEAEESTEEESAAPRQPSLIDEFRDRAEAAEKKLQEYIEAFKSFRSEQDDFRARLTRDVDRRVELKFGELVGELLDTMDDLDLALQHSNGIVGAKPLADGVEMARNRFLATLQRHGVERISPDGTEFDPNEAEAVRIDPVDDPGMNGKVTETLRPGYRLGEMVVRAARVAVGRQG